MTHLLSFKTLFLLLAVQFSTSLGYSQTDFWRESNGPFGGDVREVVSNSSGELFAGIWRRGYFRSLDNGRSWTEINHGLGDMNTTALAISTNGDLFAGFFGGGIYRSSDRGDNWMQINDGLTTLFVLTIAINSHDDLFAGTDDRGGVFRSTNNGDNWTQINSDLPNIPNAVVALAINSQNDLFATLHSNGIYRSTDSGDNWVQVNNALTSFQKMPSEKIWRSYWSSFTCLLKRNETEIRWISEFP